MIETPTTYSTPRFLSTDDEWLAALPTLQDMRRSLTPEGVLAKKAQLQSRGYRLLGIEHQGQIVCVASIVTSPHIGYGTELQIHDMVTARDYRRRGLGSRMLEEIERIATAEGAGRIFLHSVKSGEFYVKNGYTPYSSAFIKLTES